MAQNKIRIESKDLQDNPVVVYVTRPTRQDNINAQLVASETFKKAVVGGAVVRRALDALLVQQGLWSDDKQAQVDKLDKTIREKLTQLKQGGIKLNDARELAIEIRIARLNRSLLMSDKNAYDELTADAISENAKFDYLVVQCIKDENGNPIFTDVEDYKIKADENQPYIMEAVPKLATLIHGIEENWEANLPENQFLKKFKFIDEDMRLVNKDGRHITKDGKLIDNDFRYINDDGEYVDVDGNRIDQDGLPVVEFSPFLDDEGNPIVEESSEPIVEAADESVSS
jgi:hypothetical protein